MSLFNHGLCLAFFGVFWAGCGHSTLVKTDPAGGYLTLEGESLGKVPPEGLKIKRKPGFGPVGYRLVYVDGFEATGVLERTEPALLPAGFAAITGLICVPAMSG